MINLGRHKAVHPDHLERWLGADVVAKVSRDMRGWYGPPIAVHGIPGAVYVGGDGDFSGKLRAGFEATKFDRMRDIFGRAKRAYRITANRRATLRAGFSSLSDLISEATAGGKRYYFNFNKVGPTAVVGIASSLFGLGNWPAAGANPAAAPGGIAPTDDTTGGHVFTNPTGGDTLHFTTGYPQSTVAPINYLLYDRIFAVLKTVNSSSAESVTGVPTRYQSSVAANADYAGGNFAFPEVGGTVLAATAHNHDAFIYRNQAGTDTISAPSATGRSAAAVRTFDFAVADVRWFIPLAAGDTGVMDINSMKHSAAIATGVLSWVVGHPIAFLPCPIAGLICTVDGINTSFNLTRIFDDACLALFETPRIATTATTCNISLVAVAG